MQSTELSNFRKVVEFNNAFEVERYKNLKSYNYSGNVLIDCPKLVDFRANLVREEIKELADAIADNNIKEVRDALADIAYVVYGMCDCLCIDADNHLDFTFYNNESTMLILKLASMDSAHILMERAIKLNNFDALKSSLALIIQIIYSISARLNINHNDDFAVVHDSNMSKLCNTEIQAIETVKDYEDKFKAGKSEYDTPYYIYKPEINKWLVKNGGLGPKAGKVLKNKYYKAVQF